MTMMMIRNSDPDFSERNGRANRPGRSARGMGDWKVRLRGAKQLFVFLTSFATVSAILSPAQAQDSSSIRERGHAIWKAQCVVCHGEQGEGVPGKYEHRLSGPVSLEELDSLI